MRKDKAGKTINNCIQGEHYAFKNCLHYFGGFAILKTMQLRMKQAQKPVLSEKELAEISCYLKIQEFCTKF